MSVKKALITGVTGQDGSFLAELLLAFVAGLIAGSLFAVIYNRFMPVKT